MHRSGAVVALVSAALVAPAAGGCGGRFECSSFSRGNGTLEDLLGACTYGHIEENGVCAPACHGVRTAPCRCKSKAEAAEAVAAEAQSNLNISIAMLVVGLLVLGIRVVKQLLDARKAESEHAPASTVAKEHPSVEEAPPQIAPPEVVGAVSPNQVHACEAGGSEVPARQPVQGYSAGWDPCAHWQPAGPAAIGFLYVVFPLVFIAAWISQAVQSELGIMGEFHLFLGLVSLVVWVIAMAVTVLTKMGARDFMAMSRSTPFMMVIQLLGKLGSIFLPVCGAAGVAWAQSRIASPEGVYSIC